MCNISMGGYVIQYIYGMMLLFGLLQKDKILFKLRGNYDVVWCQYGYIDNLVVCSGNSKFQVVFLEKLYMGKIDVYFCKQVDGQGVCMCWDMYMVKEILYGFVLKDGKWIFNIFYLVFFDQGVGCLCWLFYCRELVWLFGLEGQCVQVYVWVVEVGVIIFYVIVEMLQEVICFLCVDVEVVLVVVVVQ